MTFLYILLGIILFFVVILSIRITIDAEYFDEFKLNIKWLFINIPVLPAKKKDKPQKEEKPKKEKPKKEPAPEPEPNPDEQGEKKENIFVTFYNNQGFDGVIQLVNNAVSSLGKMFSSFKKHIVFRELYLFMTVTGGCDAAETAMEYGRTCQKVFPAMGYIVSNFPVKKYDVTINSAQFAFSVHIRPIFFINAVIVLAVRLVFKVVLKFLKGIKNKSNKENINEGGAL